MLKINNIRVALDETDYIKVLSQYLNRPKREFKEVKLLKKSVDARHNQVSFICSFAFDIDNSEKIKDKYQLSEYVPYHYEAGKKTNRHITIVGMGPAGLFCAYTLALAGNKVTLLERGSSIEKRVKDVDLFMKEGKLNIHDNISFGEGGAGTFSDGKLTTGLKNPRIRFVLDTFLKHGAPKEIDYEANSHIGTDRLRLVMINMRKTLIQLGVDIHFDTTFLSFDDNHIITYKHDNEIHTMHTDELVLAIGHSSRDTYRYLDTKLSLKPKAFAVGVRLEQKQSKVNEIQYGKYASHPALKAANFKLAVKTSEGRGVYTFCMCPGGVVVNSSDSEGKICVNGMSYHARDKENANSAILVEVKVEDLPKGNLGGLVFQEMLEEKAYAKTNSMKAPISLVKDYMENKTSTKIETINPSITPGYEFVNLNEIFPEFINRNLKEGLQLMNKKMKGLISDDSILTAVESRSSSPVIIERNKEMQAINYPWIYPIGEGAGFAGGIMSSSIEGMKCAEKILEKGDLDELY